MAQHIATIKLNSGQGGFYDELTNIHLTVGNPIAHLFAGQNLTNIRKGIGVGHLILTEGTLGPDPRPYRLVRVGDHLEIDLKPEVFAKKPAKKEVEVKLKEEVKAPEVKEAPAEVVKEAPAEKVEEKAPVEEVKEAPAEEVKEAPVEEVKEDKPAKKATTKRTTKKAAKKADAE